MNSIKFVEAKTDWEGWLNRLTEDMSLRSGRKIGKEASFFAKLLADFDQLKGDGGIDPTSIKYDEFPWTWLTDTNWVYS